MQAMRRVFTKKMRLSKPSGRCRLLRQATGQILRRNQCLVLVREESPQNQLLVQN
ncbi:hypothetical protein RRSWK_04322 [Rhodopirellula sp. SWK7]|nr:hypothetical protein RRSWK_04322 [Rhodopirellula sp. SWK7]